MLTVLAYVFCKKIWNLAYFKNHLFYFLNLNYSSWECTVPSLVVINYAEERCDKSLPSTFTTVFWNLCCFKNLSQECSVVEVVWSTCVGHMHPVCASLTWKFDFSNIRNNNNKDKHIMLYLISSAYLNFCCNENFFSQFYFWGWHLNGVLNWDQINEIHMMKIDFCLQMWLKNLKTCRNWCFHVKLKTCTCFKNTSKSFSGLLNLEFRDFSRNGCTQAILTRNIFYQIGLFHVFQREKSFFAHKKPVVSCVTGSFVFCSIKSFCLKCLTDVAFLDAFFLLERT